MSVIDASTAFAERRWCPLQFVKSAGTDPIIYAADGLFAPLSMFPEATGRFLVRVISTARRHVPAVRCVTSVLWSAADTIELRYAPEGARTTDDAEPPTCMEMLEAGATLRVTFRAERASTPPPEVA